MERIVLDMESANCKTIEEFIDFIIREYGDESEQAKYYEIKKLKEIK